MFSRSILAISAYVALVSAAALDVFVPPITSPTADTKWTAGAVETVTWDASNAPANISNIVFSLSEIAHTIIRGRLEPQPRGPPQQVLLQLREYLKVRNAQDRAAMSKLMVSSHPLAIEQLRHASGVRNKRKKLAVPRDQWLCRFCNIAIESPEHALLTCEGSAALSALRAEFYAKIQPLRPDLAAAATDVNAQDTLRSLLGAREITSLLAAFVRRTFTIFESVELVWPAQYCTIPTRSS
ncbi:hypothetical protein PENSPDRAFT_758571 [Peniophora sp. CONT]|nr:hypothetical protein PENSPDRAFT_758571 [Peniophora sp. CONT]